MNALDQIDWNDLMFESGRDSSVNQDFLIVFSLAQRAFAARRALTLLSLAVSFVARACRQASHPYVPLVRRILLCP
jgi:hypothetical protein